MEQKKDEPTEAQKVSQKVDDGDSSGPDADSRASGASSISTITRTRPNSRRSQVNRDKKARISQEKAMLKRLQSGGVWQESVPRSEWNAAKKALLEEQVPRITQKLSMMSVAFQGPEAVPENVPFEIQELARQTVTRYIQNGQCLLCVKTCDHGHLNSKEHAWAVHVHSVDTYFCGWPSMTGPRPRNRGVTPTWVSGEFELNIDCLTQYWGTRVMDFAKKAEAVIKAKGGMLLKRSEHGKGVLLPASSVQCLVPAVVSYRAMSGRYNDKTKMAFLHDLPLQIRGEGASESQWWPVVVVSLCPKLRRSLGLNTTVPVGSGVHANFEAAPKEPLTDEQLWADDGEEVEVIRPVAATSSGSSGSAAASSSSAPAAAPLTESPHASYAACVRQLASFESGPIVAWPLRLTSRL